MPIVRIEVSNKSISISPSPELDILLNQLVLTKRVLLYPSGIKSLVEEATWFEKVN